MREKTYLVTAVSLRAIFFLVQGRVLHLQPAKAKIAPSESNDKGQTFAMLACLSLLPGLLLNLCCNFIFLVSPVALLSRLPFSPLFVCCLKVQAMVF